MLIVISTGQQNSNRMLTQDRPSNFLDQTVACIRAFNANSDPDDEQISKLAKEVALTVTEMTCWFGLISKIRQRAQTKASASLAQVPLSPSESRSFTSPDAGALVEQSDDSRSSRRSHSQMQMQHCPVLGGLILEAPKSSPHPLLADVDCPARTLLTILQCLLV
jgi:hypothetical protein